MPSNRDYFCHVCGWNTKNVLKDEVRSTHDPKTCILLAFVFIHLEHLSSAKPHLKQRTDLSCCVSEAVSGLWPSVTTHWLHWDLHILTFNYYLLKKNLWNPSSPCPFRGFWSASPWFKLWLYFLAKPKNSHLVHIKCLFNPAFFFHYANKYFDIV